MKNTDLKAIDGGQMLSVSGSTRHFISAYVTDTRLMGVLAVYAHWHIDNLPEDGQRIHDDGSVTWGDLHQFFYIDCEETGIETYYEVRVSDMVEVIKMEQSIIGGLGAKKIGLDEMQLRMLMNNWREFNRDHELPLPEGRPNYEFIFTDELPDEEQKHSLMEHICPQIRSDYQLINYFLMRCFGRDREGISFLSDPKGNGTFDIYDRYVQATLWRNVINKRKDTAGGKESYLCESIVEMNGNYELVTSIITVEDLRVTKIACRSISPMSSREAALTMKKSEFVTVYDMMLSEEELENNIDEFTVSFHMTMSECENGRLFLAYHPNNDHVDRRVFQLNEDVSGLLFLTVNNQLILSAYSESDARNLERKLRSNVLAPYLLIRGRYEFKNPVLYEFMHSDIDFFEAYLELLKGGR